MTFDEIEKWLILVFAAYHRKKDMGIDTLPLTKWREGLLGMKNKPGRGLPARRLDDERLRINFMPFIERTVQNYGVLIDAVHYYHDVLRPWINAPHPEFKNIAENLGSIEIRVILAYCISMMKLHSDIFRYRIAIPACHRSVFGSCVMHIDGRMRKVFRTKMRKPYLP